MTAAVDKAVRERLERVRRGKKGDLAERLLQIGREWNPILSRRLDELLRDVQIAVEPVTLNRARIAREAYRDFGKCRHRAGLNLRDCFAYALAKEKDETLLFKGDDFRHTDVEYAGGPRGKA